MLNLCCVCVFSDELRQLRAEREELEKETEGWKAKQTKERDKETQQHKYVWSCDVPLIWLNYVSFHSTCHAMYVTSTPLYLCELEMYAICKVLLVFKIKRHPYTLVVFKRNCHQLLLDSHLKLSFYGENLLMPIVQITADASVMRMLCSCFKNVPANTVGIIVKIHWRIVCMQIMSKYITAREEAETAERDVAVWAMVKSILWIN